LVMDAASGFRPRRVLLHVYDLAWYAAPVNSIAKNFGSGLYHAGIEVFGKEWSYYYVAPDVGTGILCNTPRQHPHHAYRETVDLGDTEYQYEDVQCLIHSMQQHWPGHGYSLLRRNCVTFSSEFARALGVGPVPEYVRSATESWSQLLPSGLSMVNVDATADVRETKQLSSFCEAVDTPMMTPAPTKSPARIVKQGDCDGDRDRRLVRGAELLGMPEHLGKAVGYTTPQKLRSRVDQENVHANIRGTPRTPRRGMGLCRLCG